MPGRRLTGAPAGAAALALVLGLLPAAGAAANELILFQQGGRGVAQAGAFVARADDAFAATYNPAGLAALDGPEIAVGAGAVDPSDEYAERFQFLAIVGPPRPDFVGASRSAPATALLPTFHLAWRDEERLGRWAFGLALDTPFQRTLDWGGGVESVPFDLQRREIELRQVHAVAAYRLSEAWSVGGGVRYLEGDDRTRRTSQVGVNVGGPPFFTFPFTAHHAVEVDGVGWDVGVRYARADWGAGAVFRTAVEVEGGGRTRTTTTAAPEDPAVAAELERRLGLFEQPFDARIDLPAEAAAGLWFRPLPALRAEIDVVHTAWSDHEQRGTVAQGPVSFPLGLFTPWDDTTSLRLGVEADLGGAFTLGAGVAHEPSPIDPTSADPAAFRGDALVLALGGTYRRGPLALDLGLSRHDFERVDQRQVHPRFGVRDSTYESEAWVAGVTVRYGWR